MPIVHETPPLLELLLVFAELLDCPLLLEELLLEEVEVAPPLELDEVELLLEEVEVSPLVLEEVELLLEEVEVPPLVLEEVKLPLEEVEVDLERCSADRDTPVFPCAPCALAVLFFRH